MKYSTILNNGSFKNSAKYNCISANFAVSMAISVVGVEVFKPKTILTTTSKISKKTAQMTKCKIAVQVVVIIFTYLCCSGLIDVAIISMIRVVFSSVTVRIYILT